MATRCNDTALTRVPLIQTDYKLFLDNLNHNHGQQQNHGALFEQVSTTKSCVIERGVTYVHVWKHK